MNSWRHAVALTAPLVLGVVLLAVTLARTDAGAVSDVARQIGLAFPIALLPSAAWHALRTIAWQQCFDPDARPSFPRAFRLRLAAEAFSFLTISGFAGDPLKVVLLYGQVAPPIAAAAVALERVLYLATTMLIVAVAAAIAVFALPLSTAWVYVYSAVAIGSLALLLCAGAAILWTSHRSSARPSAEAPAVGRVRQFVRDFDVNVRGTIRRDPRRLAVVVLLQTAAYGTMALEVWLALWLTHAAITWADAVAVETFTRVTSMATAFIPAGIGALEASNVAGAAAVHAAGGGLALALIRRVRGLFWCGAGLLVYPTPRRRLAITNDDVRTDCSRQTGSQALAVVLDSDAEVGPSDSLGGLPIGERIARAAARAGYQALLVWSPTRAAAWQPIARDVRSRIAVDPVSDAFAWRERIAAIDPASAVTVIAPGIVASPAAVESARAPECEGGVYRISAADLHSPATIAATLDDRIATPPATFSVRTRDELASAERLLRGSIFKSTDGDLATFNRRLSIPISVALIRLTRMSANVMSGLIIVLGLLAGWSFSRGTYAWGVMAALISWASSVLDGCDGELARLQYTESAFGCWVDTIGDYTYYIAIFVGLTVGSVRATGSPIFWSIGAVMGAGLIVTLALLIVLRGRITAGRPDQLNANARAHFYRSGKRWNQLAVRLSICGTRAVMPYGILVLAAANLLPVVLIVGAVATHIYWISLATELKHMLAVDPAFARARS